MAKGHTDYCRVVRGPHMEKVEKYVVYLRV